jgi:hypothetical protein
LNIENYVELPTEKDSKEKRGQRQGQAKGSG